jgi:hypothetical protein
MKPLVIGKLAKPRCFQNVKLLPVDYKSNGEKDMVTSALFINFLQKFNLQLRKEKKVLLVENCSRYIS